MGQSIEMWSYSQYENLFELRLVASNQTQRKEKNSSVAKVPKVKTGYEMYSVDEHLEGKDEIVKELFKELQDKVLAFDSEGLIQELARKMYVAYRTNRNFVYVNFRSDRLFLDVSLTVEEIKSVDQSKIRDMRGIGHYGRGYSRYDLHDFDHFEEAMALLKESYLRTQ